MTYPETPDGRYFVAGGRLWRRTNPELDDATRTALVRELMAARRAVKVALATGSREDLAAARAEVHRTKVALGERGPTWWGDSTDYNRRKVENTPYEQWWRRANSGGKDEDD